MRYYKKKDGSAWFNFKPAVTEQELKTNYTEITKEQWLEHKSERENRQPTAAQLRRKEISHLKAFLNSTDWIICKIAEETDADEIAALRTKYASVIAERKSARSRINELEGE